MSEDRKRNNSRSIKGSKKVDITRIKWQVVFDSFLDILNLAEEEIYSYIQRYIDIDKLKPDEKARMFQELSQKQREITAMVEKWIEERVRKKLPTLPNPFKVRVNQLKERIEKLRERIEKISDALDKINHGSLTIETNGTPGGNRPSQGG